MSIIRAPRPTEKFYILDKRISEDSRLSWAARGLLVFLLGKPDHWQVSIVALTNETGMGRDGVRSLLAELKSAGYVTHGQPKEAGRFGVGLYEVSELAAMHATKGRASTDLPSPVEPEAVEPSPVIPPQVRTDLKQGLNKPIPTKAGVDQAPLFGDLPKAPSAPKDDPMAGFDLFWKTYPRKVAKADAAKAWPKAVKAAGGVNRLLRKLVVRMEAFDMRDNCKFVPYPASWLNGGRWEDDAPPIKPANGSGLNTSL